jgi:hypothetical protein
MSSLIHPIPPGLKVPNFVYTSLSSQDASSQQKIQAENLVQALKKHSTTGRGGAHGVTRQLSAKDMAAAIARRREDQQ